MSAEPRLDRVPLSSERKQVTVLFADVVGSTGLAERLGAEVWTEVIQGAFARLQPVIRRHQGTVSRLMGDGILALFGAPVAHEGDERRALEAAIDLQDEAAAYGQEVRRRYSVDFALRVGVNTGTAVLGLVGDEHDAEYTAMGDAANLAHRLQELAQPGAVLISESTYRRAAAFADCLDRGTTTVKGRAAPVRLYELRGRRAFTRQERGPRLFVGRQSEVAAVMRCLGNVAAGQGGVLTVTGDAGLGKSSLLAETRRLAAEAGIRWLDGAVSSFGPATSYAPFVDMLRTEAGIAEGDGPDAAWRKLRDSLHELFPAEPEELLPYLATMLGVPLPPAAAERLRHLDDESMGRQVYRAVWRLLECLAQRPLVLCIEDLHWLDASSAGLLEHVLGLTERTAVLICCTTRPDPGVAARLKVVFAERCGQRWTDVALTPLSEGDCEAVSANVLGGPMAPEVRELVVRRAEGNPFFAEEIVLALRETGALQRDPAGQWRLAAGQLAEGTVPATIQGVVAARIDRLEPSAKDTLKVAAVIGRTFSVSVLAEVSGHGEALPDQLARLAELDLVHMVRREPEPEYAFKHALTQEAAYDSLLASQRRALHRQVGACVERLFAERLEDFYGLLAHHFAEAEDWPTAQSYLLKAGDQAGRVAADATALAHYESAFAACEQAFGHTWDGFERAVLERKIGQALVRVGDNEAGIEHLSRALAFLGHPWPKGRFALGLAILKGVATQALHIVFPRLTTGKTRLDLDPVSRERFLIYEPLPIMLFLTDQAQALLAGLVALNLWERLGYAPGIARGSMLLGVSLDVIPLFRLAERYHRRAIEFSELSADAGAVGVARMGAAVHARGAAQLLDAEDNYKRMIRSATQAGDIATAAAGQFGLCWLSWLTGNIGRAEDHADDLIRLGRETNHQQALGWGLYNAGTLSLLAGRFERAAEELEEALRILLSVPDYMIAANAYCTLGLVMCRLGRPEQALQTSEKGMALVRQRKLRSWIVQPAFLMDAELKLAVAEQSREAQAIAQARRSCRRLWKQRSIAREVVAPAHRYQAGLDSLRGRGKSALRHWRKSLDAATRQGFSYEAALTELDLARHTRDRDRLAQLELTFERMGAHLKLAEARALLAH